MAKALENVRVLDFTRFYAGPFCTMLLQDLGAEIIKIEIPGSGDAIRNFTPITEGGEGYIFINLNRGKKSITLNLESEKGREIARELVLKSDILVENFHPGVMDEFGLGYKELSEINPSLIYASISGFGQTGPYSSQVAYDMIAQAMGGLMSVTGFPNNPPTRAGTAIGDFISSFYTAIAILAALRHKEKTGEGQLIDISLQDCIWALTAIEYAPLYFLTGNTPQRYGNGVFNVTPFETYPTKDGYAAICIVTVGQWETFIRAIGRRDLIGVAKYATQNDRVKYRTEIDALVSEWTKARTTAEVVGELSNAGLPCSPLPTFDEVANDPQLLSRQMTIEVEQLISGRLKVPGSVFKLSKTSGDASSPAPFLGQHNYEVYSNLLDYSEQEVTRLADDGVI